MSEQNKRTVFERRPSPLRNRHFRPAGHHGVFLLGDPALQERIEVHAMIEDTLAALPRYLLQDYSIAIEPFPTSQGKCVVLQDMQGNRLCILDRAGSPVAAV